MKKLIINKKAEIIRTVWGIIIIALMFISAYFIEISYIIPLLMIVAAFYFEKVSKDFRNLALPLSLFVVIIIVSSMLFIQYSLSIPFISVFHIPVIAISMLTMILFNDLKTTLIITIISSFCAGKILSNDIDLGLTFFIGGIISGLFVYRARRRGTIITAGLLGGTMQLFCLLLLYPTTNLAFENIILRNEAGKILSGVLVWSFVAGGSLPLFEYLFKVVTNVSLLEMSDFNHPILKKMIIEAPGTYQHSLVVGNLAEAAAEAIGINSLLARVGAYYHDIGKIEKSEYFSENQMLSTSKHDNLQPTMSRLIIINHVKEGVELARRHHLNPIIEEFIMQHHGTSLMYYFYRRALEDTEVRDDVEEDGFRYPGPKPQRKEVAVVLLADSVEAAIRSLDEPTPERITEIVHKIINNKFIDGQLDLCELTLSDLNKIASTFTRILSAIYHSRVKYPDEKSDESIFKEPSEKKSRQKQKNSKPGPENPQS